MTRVACALLLALLAWVKPVLAFEWVGSGGHCEVKMLGPEDEDGLDARYKGKISNVSAYETYRLVVSEALAQMPPLTCEAVQRIVFVRDFRNSAGEEGFVEPNQPDLVHINLDVVDPLREPDASMGAYWIVKTMQAILHESTHAADMLLFAHGADEGLLGARAGKDWYIRKITTHTPEPEDWPESAQALARTIVEKNRLGGSLRAEWNRIQEAFIAFGLAGPYLGPGFDNDDPALLTKAGFTSRYAGAKVGEDIAEMAAWMLAAPLMGRSWNGKTMPAKGIDNFACKAMQARDGRSVPADLALFFTKANLLLSAGLVTQAAYDTCVGQLSLRGPGTGVFVYQFVGDPADDQAELKRNYHEDVEFGMGADQKQGVYVANLSARGTASVKGEEVVAVFSLSVAFASAEQAIETLSWPRGIFNLADRQNVLKIEVPSDPARTFVSSKGVVLFSQASKDRIEGSVFLQQAFRPFAPLGIIPQEGMPMRFTFNLQN